MRACALVLLLCPLLLGAERERVVVVVDSGGKPYEEAVSAIVASGRAVERVAVDDAGLPARLRAPAGPDAWIALGPRSAALLAGASDRPRAAALVSEHEAPAGLPVVTLEVSLQQQARWVRAALPGRTRLVVLRDPRGPFTDERLRAAADAAGLALGIVDVTRPGEAVPALESSLRRGAADGVLWILPDKAAVTADTVAPLVQAALQSRVPVVGFSPYFLRIGAVAAVSVDYGGAALQALALAKGGDPARVPPEKARLVVEGRLAERLGVPVRAGPGVEVRR